LHPAPSRRLPLCPVLKQPRLNLLFPLEEEVDLDEARIVKANAREIGPHYTAARLVAPSYLFVSRAFGLTVLTMGYAIGHISGCHLNPAVSVGLLVSKRFPASELVPYVIAQVLGGIAGAAVLYFIASGQDGFAAGGNASN
jgi:glycerol uptake facilitator-like aquaporin